MNEHYYGVGRIRALETRLLTPAQIERIANAYDFEAAMGVLSETTYSEILPRLKNPFDFEELCQLELVSLKGLMERVAPGNEILKALFRKYDYLNLKIMLRSLFAGTEGIATFSQAGTIPLDRVKAYVFEDLRDLDEKELIEVIGAAKAGYEQDKDPVKLDLILDQHYFSYLKQTAELSPSPLLKEMVSHKIDLFNIKTVLRAQALMKDNKFLKEALLIGGSIDRQTLLGLHDKTGADIISRLNFTVYFPALAEGLDYYDQQRSFYLLEKAMDDFTLSHFRQAKYLSSGIEPLIGFVLAKESEVMTLRFMLICKKNLAEAERIRERIRISYA